MDTERLGAYSAKSCVHRKDPQIPGVLDAVESVTQYRICYSKEFRDDCMRRYAEGGSPAAIFREAGLDPKIIGYKRVERCIARWKAENAEKAAQEQEAQE